jgi:hypothetical protein
MKKGVSFVLILSSAALFGGLAANSVLAQNAPPSPRKIQLTSVDTAAADEATVVFSHVHPAKNPAGAALKRGELATPGQRANSNASTLTASSAFEGGDKLRFPADLTYNGGAVVPFAQSHPIFLLPNGSCPIATCWGDPESFLTDFANSDLAHVTDQYVGQHSRGRYILGDEFALSYTPTPPTAPLTDANIRAIVHAAALFSGETGYEHIFHVFLPPGQDECFTAAATACYSPDVPNSFAFCAYHSSVTFQDVGHVLYSVEPFQNVDGCRVRPGTPNGQLIDSTNSTLSHELIETITDPDGDAWFNFTAVVLAGQEIGDECDLFTIQQVSPTQFAVFGDPTVFRVGKHRYATQPEYSNNDHGCGVAP